MANDWPAAHPTTARVLVIIPSHNHPALLQEALSSVLDQTALPAEIIIIDDASAPSQPASEPQWRPPEVAASRDQYAFHPYCWHTGHIL